MSVTVTVTDMTCQGCESVVETAVELLDGVEAVDADRYENVVTVSGDVDADDVVGKVELAGYTATPGQDGTAPEGQADDEAGGEGGASEAHDDEPVRDLAEGTSPVDELAEEAPGGGDDESTEE